MKARIRKKSLYIAAAVASVAVIAAAILLFSGSSECRRMEAAAARMEGWLASSPAIEDLKTDSFPADIYETGVGRTLSGVALENLNRMEHVMDTVIYGDIKAAVGYTKRAAYIRAADRAEGPCAGWLEATLDRMDKKARVLEGRGTPVIPSVHADEDLPSDTQPAPEEIVTESSQLPPAEPSKTKPEQP